MIQVTQMAKIRNKITKMMLKIKIKNILKNQAHQVNKMIVVVQVKKVKKIVIVLKVTVAKQANQMIAQTVHHLVTRKKKNNLKIINLQKIN